jgi:HAE1 family hydrophobic/amphiphilic exporter-1
MTLKVSDGMSWFLGFAARPTQSGFAAVQRAYLPALRWSLEHRGRIVAVSVGVLLVTAALVPRLGSELIPQLSQGEFIADIRLTPGTPLEQTDHAMAAAQAQAMGLPDIALSYAVTGTGNRSTRARRTLAKTQDGSRSRSSTAPARTRSRRRSMRPRKVRRARRRAIPVQPPALFNFSSPLEADHRLRPRPAAPGRRTGSACGCRRARRSATSSRRRSGNPEIQIVFDQERAAQLGLTVRARRPVSRRERAGDVATRYKLREEDRRAGPQRRHARLLGREIRSSS